MPTDARLDAWLRSAVHDAERRGLGDLVPLLETLARSTANLRNADRQGPAEIEDSPVDGRDATRG